MYRLICKGTIEERILQRAREKSEIHKMVIQGGSFKGGQKSGSDLKPKEVVSLLLDDEEIESRVRMKVEEEQEKTVAKDKVEVRKTARKREADKATEEEDNVKKVRPEIEEGDSEEEDERLGPDPRPLLDFAGDKMGPKRLKGRGGGKRGRPRGSGRGLARGGQ